MRWACARRQAGVVARSKVAGLLERAACRMSGWHWDASHLEERASRVKCNREGGLEESGSKPAKNPTEDLSDPYIDDFLACQQLNHGLSGLLMAITRTDNNNTVVYQARSKIIVVAVLIDCSSRSLVPLIAT